jgi:ABC-type polysaccharide/polyol phosphate export permease
MPALTLRDSLAELPEYRRVLRTLVARDLKVKYQTKALGFLWSLLYPALMIAIWYVVFKRVMKLDMPHYWAFLIVGMLPFQFVQNAIHEGASSVRKNAGLIRKIYIPMEVLVIAGVTVKAIEFLLQLAVAILVLLVAHHGDVAGISLTKTIFVLPAAVGLLYLFVLGLSLPLAAWTVIYRDLEHMVSIVLMAMMYLTPVFWSLTFVGERWWKPLFALNPVLDFIELLRGPLYWGQWPSNGALGGGAVVAWGVAGFFAVASFVFGYELFDRAKHILAEVV